MTGSKVAFDTWAWWEVLRASPAGARLRTKYLDDGENRIFTSAISLGEIAAKLASEGRSEEIGPVVSSLRGASDVVEVSGELAIAGGILRAQLRHRTPDASLADGIVLAMARSKGAILVSADRAFRSIPDVRNG